MEYAAPLASRDTWRFCGFYCLTFGGFVGLANFADSAQSVDTAAFGRYGWLETVLSSDGPLDVHDGRAHLPALGFAWLVER